MAAAHGSASNRWTASWIWDKQGLREGQRQVIAAKAVVELASVPAQAPGRIFADARYVLYANGTEIRRGPVRASARSRRYDDVDLGPALRTGTNVITIIAAVEAGASRNWFPGPTSASELGGGALAFEADLGDAGVIGTGPDWLTTPIPGWGLSEPTGVVSVRGLEEIDLRSIPEDLHSPGSEASRWRPARVKSGRTMGDRESVRPPSYPFGPTKANPLTPQQPRPRPLAELRPGLWALPDIGAGTVVFDISGEGGEKVEVQTYDKLSADGEVTEFHEPIGMELIAPAGRATAETLDVFGLRALAIEAPASVTIHAVTLVERLHPVTGGGTFRSSDPYLDHLYEVGRRTVSLCSLDSYVDNPTREGRAWTGDVVVHQMVDLASNGDWTLARWNPRMASYSATADGVINAAVAGDGEYGQYTIVTDWPLHWVRSIWNLHRYVGDKDEIADLLPDVQRALRWFEQFTNPTTGLPTDVYGWTLVDWAWVPTNGASSVLTGLLGRALLDLADLADFVGDVGTAHRARGRHAQLSEAFELFWDPELERYADVAVAGVRGETASVHAQATAIVAGFAPRERYARLVDLMTDRSRMVHATLSVPEGDPGFSGDIVLPGFEMLLQTLPSPWWNTREQMVMTQPFYRYVVHDALAQAGRADLILDSLQDWQRLLDRCDTSFAETFWSGTVAQGWSSTPTRDLITQIAGVTPAEPGYAAVQVAPVLGHLEWLEAEVPTPHGTVRVRVDSDSLVVDSPVPVHVSGKVLPSGKHTLPPSS